SLVLITVAVLFLRNQIRPVLRLADAAESFGKGREVPDFRPRGAREVRRAAVAFIEMKRRIERALEQRTAMLAGVSHDLRTILTRFKLELALIGESPEVEAMKKDVDEMARESRRICGKRCSSRSCGSMMRAIRTKAAPDSGLPSRATSPAPTAATSPCRIVRSEDCARQCGCRSRPRQHRARLCRAAAAGAAGKRRRESGRGRPASPPSAVRVRARGRAPPSCG